MTEKNAKHIDASTRLPLHLCPPILQVRVAAVMKAALSKPGRVPYNYQGESSLTSYMDAAKRHLAKLEDGEWLDEDSGEPHAAAVAANMAIILHCDLHGTLQRDLPGETRKISALIDEYQEKYKDALKTQHPGVVKFEDGKDCGDPDCKASECIQTRVERMSARDLFKSVPEDEVEKYKKLWESANAALLTKIRLGRLDADLGTAEDEASGLAWLETQSKPEPVYCGPWPCPNVPESLQEKGWYCTREAGHDGPCAAEQKKCTHENEWQCVDCMLLKCEEPSVTLRENKEARCNDCYLKWLALPRCYCDESGISPTTPCKGCPRWGTIAMGREPKAAFDPYKDIPCYGTEDFGGSDF